MNFLSRSVGNLTEFMWCLAWASHLDWRQASADSRSLICSYKSDVVEFLMKKKGQILLWPFDEQRGNEILGIRRDGGEGVVVEIVVARRDVGKSVGVVVAHERRQSRQSKWAKCQGSSRMLLVENKSNKSNLQDVADDAEGPHVSGASDGLVADNFRSDKFRRAKQDTNGRVGVQLTGQTEIDEFDSMRIGALAQNVFRLFFNNLFNSIDLSRKELIRRC